MGEGPTRRTTGSVARRGWESARRHPYITGTFVACTALGFVAGPALGPGAGVTLYVYDVSTYKRTPAWLNANGWAHPELWNKHRW